MTKLRRINLIALLFSFLMAFPVAYVSSATAAPYGSTAAELQSVQRYSKDLELILTAAKKHFGVNEISIGGGTARSLILAVMQGQPFTFRDFDLVFSANQNVTAESAKAFGLELEKMNLGEFSQENLRPRPRYNPALAPKEASAYNAGFGFFVNSPQGVEYDISVYHSPEALDLNGIMDVDKFQIRLKIGETLEALIRDSQRFRAAVLDPAGAFTKLLENRPPAVANWHELGKSPAMVSIRVVRTLAKFGALPIDEFTRQRIRSLMAKETNPDSLQISRNLLKLFEDKLWVEEFKSLVEIDIFRNQFKSFTRAAQDPVFFQATTIEEKVDRLLELADKKDGLLFLKLLSKLEPELVQKVLPRVIAKKNLKVGYFSGEFAPFHKGHEGVVRTALAQGALDIIFVMAVPHASNDPKTQRFSPSEWAERRAFVDAGIKSLPDAWGWPLPGMKADTRLTVDALLRNVEHFLGNPTRPLTHVFGMDSYHRVLGRDLVAQDPRPRIAVTRQGVPLPAEHIQDSVQVFQNIETRPISASRLIQEVAVTGTTEYLSADVLKLVMQTARYQTLLQENRELNQLVDSRIIETKSYARKTLYWDIRENHAGLWQDTLLPFSDVHKNILDHLLRLKPQKIVLTMYGQDPKDISARKTWEEALKTYGDQRIQIRLESQYDGVPETEKVMVVHSGVLNESLKKKNMERFLKPRGLIIFETNDQPVSAVFQGSKKVVVIPAATSKASGNRCEGIFLAL